MFSLQILTGINRCYRVELFLKMAGARLLLTNGHSPPAAFPPASKKKIPTTSPNLTGFHSKNLFYIENTNKDLKFGKLVCFRD